MFLLRPKILHTPEQANFHYLVLDIAWFGIAFSSTNRFLSVFAIRVGATPAELGLIVSLPGIVLLLSSLFSVPWRNHFSDTQHAQRLPGLGFRAIFLLPILTPFFPREWQPVWLILSATLPAIPQALGSVLFLALMRESVAKDQLTALFTRRSMMVNLTLAMSSLAYGFWLEKVSFPLNYQGMYIFAFAASMVSYWYVYKVEPQVAPTRDITAVFREMVSPWRNPRFQSVLIVVGMSYIAFFSVLALIPLRLVKELGANEGYIAIFGITELGAAIAGAYFARKAVEHLGTQRSISVAMGLSALGTLTIAFAPDLRVALLAALMTGAGWSAADVGIQSYFNMNTPKQDATRYSNAYFQVISLAIFVGPQIGSWLSNAELDLTTVLAIGALLRLLAGGATLTVNWGQRGLLPAPQGGSGD